MAKVGGITMPGVPAMKIPKQAKLAKQTPLPKATKPAKQTPLPKPPKAFRGRRDA